MEFLKRKHFSLICVNTFTFLICNCIAVKDLQGIPTWICLGIKSPFIEFRADFEVLPNTSIPLNITKDEQALMHQEGLQKLGAFIKPIDLRNSTTGYVMSNLTKKVSITPIGNQRRGMTEDPIGEEMDQKEIELLEEDPNDTNRGFPGLTDEDRKFIVPMALKNPLAESQITTTPKPTTLKSVVPMSLTSNSDSSNNIEDLKNHILMLQNLTRNDQTFQSKFVVFPNLQKERNTTHGVGSVSSSNLFTEKPLIPQTAAPFYKSRPNKTKIIFSDNEEFDHFEKKYFEKEKVTITPQVFLLNDQTPRDDDNSDDYEVERWKPEKPKKRDRTVLTRRNRKKNPKSTTTTTTTTTTTVATTTSTEKELSQKRVGNSKRSRNGENRGNKKRQNCKNPDSIRCQRQRRLQDKLKFNLNETQYTEHQNNSRSLGSDIDPILLQTESSSVSNNDKKKSKTRQQRNAGVHIKFSAPNSPYFDGGHNKDLIIPIGNSNLAAVSGGNANFNTGFFNNNQTISTSTMAPYKEPIDLNPDLCYKVDGMSFGQQKLCFMHTSIMPAISRGARATIQECQHQFKNRRWNCSTTNDNTVFGPMSAIGSPEIAFIHALAAAAVTSFIARACRDGQLASCGCSKSSRPRQLHDDWTWGGCGDDLEFAYKFSQDFIDAREKERKRGIRGLVNGPSSKTQLDEKFSPESTTSRLTNSTTNFTTGSMENKTKDVNNNDNHNDMNHFKPKVLLELQEKITKEILNSKLQENEMLELQEKINREIMNSKIFAQDHYHAAMYTGNKKSQRNVGSEGKFGIQSVQFGSGRFKNGISAKARSLMNLHNNEAGRRAVIKKTRITCKCHGVSGSCSMITCWQQLSSIREIGDFLREKFDAATEVKLNKRGRLQIKDPRYKVPTAHDLVYLDESPDWCRNNKQLQWSGTHGRICNKTSSGLDGCAILCCGRGYNTKNIIVKERCNCKFHWCCQVKCEICIKMLEEHSCK